MTKATSGSVSTDGNLLTEIEQLRAVIAATQELAQEKERALASYQASEARYRTVFENTATATFVKENDLTISMVNTGFEASPVIPRLRSKTG